MVPTFDDRFCVLYVLCVLLISCSPKPSATPPETPPPVQEIVSYLSDNKSIHGYLCRPAGPGTFPAVLLIHDSMGLTDAMKDAAFRLARRDYVVLAVDLYRGRAPNDTERELPKDRVLRDLKSAVDYLCEREEVRPEQLVEQGKLSRRIGVIGLGTGGSFALEAALHDSRLRALVLCYCPLPTAAKQLATLKASVFGIFAGKDKSVSADAIAQFTRAMREAHKDLSPIRVYGDSAHGFLDPAYWRTYGKPPEENVAEAWELIARFLDRILM